MGKRKLKIKKGRATITNKIKFPETIHERALKLLNANYLEGFLPVEIKRKKKKAVITCVASGMIQAKKYFAKPTNMFVFLDFVAQIIERISVCNKNYLNPNNILLSLSSIFIVDQTRSVKCVYWPVVNSNEYVLAKDFFKSLPSYVNFSKNQDLTFLHEYELFFSGIQAFSLLEFEKLIMDLAGKESKDSSFSPESKLLQSSRVQAQKEQVIDHSDKSYDILSQLNEPEAVSQINIHKKATRGTTVLTNSGNLWSDNNSALIDSSGNKFSISGTSFWVGKPCENNELSLDNGAVSRRHARIIFEHGKYYLIDNNSTNHTYLNGHKLNPEEYYELEDGDEIRFARSKFTFVN